VYLVLVSADVCVLYLLQVLEFEPPLASKDYTRRAC